MKNVMFLFFVLGLLLVIGLAALLQDPHDKAGLIGLGKGILSILENIFLFVIVLFSGITLGFLTRHLGLEFIDIKAYPNLNFTKTKILISGLLISFVFGLLYIPVFREVLGKENTWIKDIATNTYFGWRPWSGEFDRSPIYWGIYGFFTFLLGFFISARVKDFYE